MHCEIGWAQQFAEAPAMVRAKFPRYETKVDYLSDDASLLFNKAVPLKGVPDELVGMPYTKRDLGRGWGGVQLTITGAMTIYLMVDYHRADEEERGEFDEKVTNGGWVITYEKWAKTVGNFEVYRRVFTQAAEVSVPGLKGSTISVVANRLAVGDSKEIYTPKVIGSATSQPTTKEVASTQPTTIPTVVATSQPVVVDRVPVPSVAELMAGGTEAEDLFGNDISKAKTVDEQLALSKRMLNAGADETSDMGVKYAVMKRAMEIAVGAKDLTGAEAAVEEIGKFFIVDAGKMEGDTAVAISKLLGSVAERKKFVSQEEILEPSVMEKDEFVLARQLNELALAAARQTNDQPKVVELSVQGRQIGQVQTEFTKVRPVEAVLELKPLDGEANLKVGRYFCFVRGKWERGLPLLAKGDDAKLKLAAGGELKAPVDATGQLAIADGWWEIASVTQGDLQKRNCQLHAREWYVRAEKMLTGISKLKAQKRIGLVGN